MKPKKFGEWMALMLMGGVALVVLLALAWVADAIIDSMRAGCSL